MIMGEELRKAIEKILKALYGSLKTGGPETFDDTYLDKLLDLLHEHLTEADPLFPIVVDWTRAVADGVGGGVESDFAVRLLCFAVKLAGLSAELASEEKLERVKEMADRIIGFPRDKQFLWEEYPIIRESVFLVAKGLVRLTDASLVIYEARRRCCSADESLFVRRAAEELLRIFVTSSGEVDGAFWEELERRVVECGAEKLPSGQCLGFCHLLTELFAKRFLPQTFPLDGIIGRAQSSPSQCQSFWKAVSWALLLSAPQLASFFFQTPDNQSFSILLISKNIIQIRNELEVQCSLEDICGRSLGNLLSSLGGGARNRIKCLRLLSELPPSLRPQEAVLVYRSVAEEFCKTASLKEQKAMEMTLSCLLSHWGEICKVEFMDTTSALFSQLASRPDLTSQSKLLIACVVSMGSEAAGENLPSQFFSHLRSSLDAEDWETRDSAVEILLAFAKIYSENSDVRLAEAIVSSIERFAVDDSHFLRTTTFQLLDVYWRNSILRKRDEDFLHKSFSYFSQELRVGTDVEPKKSILEILCGWLKEGLVSRDRLSKNLPIFPVLDALISFPDHALKVQTISLVKGVLLPSMKDSEPTLDVDKCEGIIERLLEDPDVRLEAATVLGPDMAPLDWELLNRATQMDRQPYAASPLQLLDDIQLALLCPQSIPMDCY